MRVIHIIPSAFHYFDDIRKEAFAMVEEVEKFGITCEVYTLQYSAGVTKETKSELGTVAPSRTFERMYHPDEALQSFGEADIVHVHTPFLGAAKKILAWKKAYPHIPLVATYYRRVFLPSLFSVFIALYNNYYLPKLFSAADVVTCFSIDSFRRNGGLRFLKDASKLLVVDSTTTFLDKPLTNPTEEVQLTPPERVAAKYVIIYNNITN